MRQRRRSAVEWSRLVAEQDALGMSAPEFASARGLSVATLRWWRWRLRQLQGREAGRLLEVRLLDALNAPEAEEAEGDECARLQLPGGVVLDMEQLPSPHWLAAVCEALEARFGAEMT